MSAHGRPNGLSALRIGETVYTESKQYKAALERNADLGEIPARMIAEHEGRATAIVGHVVARPKPDFRRMVDQPLYVPSWVIEIRVHCHYGSLPIRYFRDVIPTYPDRIKICLATNCHCPDKSSMMVRSFLCEYFEDVSELYHPEIMCVQDEEAYITNYTRMYSGMVEAARRKNGHLSVEEMDVITKRATQFHIDLDTGAKREPTALDQVWVDHWVNKYRADFYY